MTYFFSPENKRKLYIFFHKSQLVKAPSNYWSGINSLGKVQTLPLLKIFKRILLTINVFCDMKILKRCFEYAFVVISSYKSCRKRKTVELIIVEICDVEQRESLEWCKSINVIHALVSCKIKTPDDKSTFLIKGGS